MKGHYLMNSKIIPKTCTPNSNRGSPLGFSLLKNILSFLFICFSKIERQYWFNNETRKLISFFFIKEAVRKSIWWFISITWNFHLPLEKMVKEWHYKNENHKEFSDVIPNGEKFWEGEIRKIPSHRYEPRC